MSKLDNGEMFGSVPVYRSHSKVGVVASLFGSFCSVQVGKLSDGGMCWPVPCFQL